MGLTLSRLWNQFFENKNARILMVGLDGAGKTTILYKLKLGEIISTIPTLGFNVDTVEYKNIKFTVWDVGGQDRIRPLWRHYYDGVQGIIYVVDSIDHARMDLAKKELDHMLAEEKLSNAIVLVFCNKQDLPGALTPGAIVDQLGLNMNSRQKWHVVATVATTGQGLYEGLDWLSREL
ncbi:hypothetical protein ACOME3_003331 [Neoechinorhynchus agilis]